MLQTNLNVIGKTDFVIQQSRDEFKDLYSSGHVEKSAFLGTSAECLMTDFVQWWMSADYNGVTGVESLE